MSAFQVPFSSSLPSTPASERIQRKSQQHHVHYGENPSTTPAGPPPSSAISLTPAGPPPQKLRSSQTQPSGGLFKNRAKTADRSSQRGVSKSILSSSHGGAGLGKSLSRNSKPVAPSRLRSSTVDWGSEGSLDDDAEENEEDEEVEEDEDDELEEDDELGDEEELEEDGDDGPFEPELPSNGRQSVDQTYRSHAHPLRWKSVNTMSEFGMSEQSQRSSIQQSPGGRANRHEPLSISKRSQLQVDNTMDSAIPTIARDLSSQLSQAKLEHSDVLVLETEWLLRRMYARLADEVDDGTLHAARETVPEALCKLWQSCCHRQGGQSISDRTMDGIGPPEELPMHRATFLATLLLKLHHPPTAKGRQAFVTSPSSSVLATSLPPPLMPQRMEPYPKVLLDWLEEHHHPYKTALVDLRSHYPNPVAHAHFWDIILSGILRGKLREVVEILSEADFHASTLSAPGGQGVVGYEGQELGNVQVAIHRAIQILDSAPSMTDGDWNVVGADWALFRKRAENAADELDVLAAERSDTMDANDFEAHNFGVTSTSGARRATGKLPWEIHLHLKELYGILLGATIEIMSAAQDWVEASMGLAIWWPGDDDETMDIAVTSLTATKKSLRRSHSRLKRTVDADPARAYRTRLRRAFQRVTSANDDEAFQINSLDAIEVGLASTFEGNVAAVLAFLAKWCLPIASAMMEVSTLAGWYSTPAGDGLMDGFDADDLMVLTYGQPDKGLTRDGLLVEYTGYLMGLSDTGRFATPAGPSVDAWELATRVLNRVSDESLRTRKMGELLSHVPVDSDGRADKLIDLCRYYGLEKQACDVAVKYATAIAEASQDYGTALKYYARAHDAKKVKDVLDFLTSYSLVQSIAYPPAEQLDGFLASLLQDPRTTVARMAMVDVEAANLLQFYVGGYATMRLFYETRDSGSMDEPLRRPLATRKAAAPALLAVIASASDSIRGGLYDPTSDSVMQVDGLLALLGEALLFIDQPTRFLTLAQIIALLGAIEDLETVHSRIYLQCNDFLQSTLAAAQQQRVDPPRHLLQKSVSSMTASSTFSLVGSSMLDASIHGDDGGQHPRRPPTQLRGWDWRSAVHDKATGKEVIALLRLGLAKEVAKAWMDGE